MRENTVEIDRATAPVGLRFSPRFNVAVPFIDRHVAEGRGEKTAILTTGGERVTYAALAENVNRCGNALLAQGLRRGDRVLLVVKDCPAFFYLFWGAIKAGIVPVPLNTLLRAGDYAYMIADSGCRALAYSPEYAGEVEPALERAGAAVRALRLGERVLQDLLAAASPSLAPAPASAEDDCFWLYSSGSTGRPKGAVHRHRDMVVTSQRYGADWLGVREDDIVFSEAKLFFAYGLGNGMTFPLWVGAMTVLSDARPAPAITFDILARFRPTLHFGVPTLYAAHLKALETARADFSSVRWCVSAGEALPAEILKRWREATGTTILDGIGSTEALHMFISNRPGDVKPGSSGRVIAGYSARIVDEAGNDVPEGESGRLLIAGGSTARCYWNNPERTARTMLEGGWLDTGDTYVRDREGYYFYQGRSDDMLKVGGIWCSPFEIEASLVEHPKVLEAAVIGRADADGLVKPEAHVELKDRHEAGEALAAELLQHCKSRLAPYKYPRWVRFLPELPKTATGKIQRYKLREAAARDSVTRA